MNNSFTITVPNLLHIIDKTIVSLCRMDYAKSKETGIKYYCYICKRYVIEDKKHKYEQS